MQSPTETASKSKKSSKIPTKSIQDATTPFKDTSKHQLSPVVEEDAEMSTIFVEAVDDGDPVLNSLTGQLDAGNLVLSIIVEVDGSSVITDANYLPEMQSTISGSAPFNFTMLLPEHAFGEAIVSVDVTDPQSL